MDPSITSSFTSLRSGSQQPPPQLTDQKALTAYIIEQMAMMQSQQESGTNAEPSSSSGEAAKKLHTAYLPNFMWYQPVAADSSPSGMIRPTSLCSGTGITGDQQYLQPDMLSVFNTFGSYFLGSGHLFQEERGGDDTGKSAIISANKRRSAFWVETINEQDVESSDSESSGSASEIESSSVDESTVESLESSGPSNQMQKEIVEKVIEELRRSKLITTNPLILQDYTIRDKSQG